jgi:hypothetical protein
MTGSIITSRVNGQMNSGGATLDAIVVFFEIVLFSCAGAKCLIL